MVVVGRSSLHTRDERLYRLLRVLYKRMVYRRTRAACSRNQKCQSCSVPVASAGRMTPSLRVYTLVHYLYLVLVPGTCTTCRIMTVDLIQIFSMTEFLAVDGLDQERVGIVCIYLSYSSPVEQ